MNWIFDHFQIIVVIALALASWLKHRADTRNAEAEERRAREEMADDDSPFGRAEDWLPPPAPSVPPPLVRTATPPPLRVDVSETEPLLQRQIDMQERLREIKAAKSNTRGGAAATRDRVLAAGKPAKSFSPGKTRLRDDLRDSRKTRRAIVLREILGPPLGLR